MPLPGPGSRLHVFLTIFTPSKPHHFSPQLPVGDPQDQYLLILTKLLDSNLRYLITCHKPFPLSCPIILTYTVYLICLQQTSPSFPKPAPRSISVIRMGRATPHRQTMLLRELGEEPKMPPRRSTVLKNSMPRGASSLPPSSAPTSLLESSQSSLWSLLKAKEMPVQHWESSGSDWEAGKIPDLIFGTEQCEGGLFTSHRETSRHCLPQIANTRKEWTRGFGCSSWTNLIWSSLLTVW